MLHWYFTIHTDKAVSKNFRIEFLKSTKVCNVMLLPITYGSLT